MARNEVLIEAAPETVFAILSDPHAYSDWVVGAKRIRGYDPTWPSPGSAFHHSVGVGPLSTRDKTTVRQVDAPKRMVLEARAMPAGVAEVAIDLHREGDKTRVVIEERPLAGLAAKVYNPVLDLVVRARNAGSLRRLRVIAESRAATHPIDE